MAEELILVSIAAINNKKRHGTLSQKGSEFWPVAKLLVSETWGQRSGKGNQHCTKRCPSGKGRRVRDQSRGSDVTRWFSPVAMLRPVIIQALNTQLEVNSY